MSSDSWAAARRWWCALACSIALFALTGCDAPPSSDLTPEAADATPLNEAERILQRMLDTYAKADSYADRGELRITGKRDGEAKAWKVPFSTMLVRPKKLRVEAYQAVYITDGANAWGYAEDVPGMILKRPAPKVVTLGEVYGDDVLREYLTGGLVGEPLAPAMLLGAADLGMLRQQGERPETLSDEYVDGRLCRRVRIRRADGDLVYWIDRESDVLRRIQYPAKRLELTFAMTEPVPHTDLAFSAEFFDAALNPQIPPEAFAFDPPPQIKLVEKLTPKLIPPGELSPVLGAKLGDFKLRKADGTEVTPASLRGKTAVVMFWSLGANENLSGLKALDAVRRKFAGRDDVVFLPINRDVAGAGGVSDADIERTLAELKLELPVVRDVENGAVAAFENRFQPSFFIVDRDGVVQDHEVGIQPGFAEEFQVRIADVAAGKSLVAAARRRYEDRLREFTTQQRADGPAGGGEGEIPRAAIAAKSQPKTLKLTELWKSTAVKQPGFVLATAETQGPPRIVVADGLRGVAELDAQGKLVRSVALDLPKEPEAVVSFYRTAVARDGKRYFVGSCSAQQQLHLFDADFKRLLSFPAGSHDGIADVQFGDIDGDGTPEICVGYWGLVGMQSVGLDGVRKWSNRRLPENIMKLAVTGADREGRRLLLCTTGVMTVAVVDEKGETLKEMPVGERAARLVAAADLNGDGGVELCAIAATGPGTDVAVGFDAAGRELWSYPLPAGVQPVPEMQNELVVGGKLFDDGPGVWIFAGADGSVHIVGLDGKPIDSFATGEAIRGLALGALDGRPALLVSDAKSVTALRLER